MMPLYSIRDWNKHFELAQSRKVEGALSWVAMPTKHDGLGYKKILSRKDGPALYGAWVLIVQVAAKCPRRGVLADETGPLSVDDLHLKTSCSRDVLTATLNLLSSKEIGWIVVDEWEESGIQLPSQDITEQDITLQNSTESAPLEGGCNERLLAIMLWWNDLKSQGLVPAGVSVEAPSEAVRKGWSRVERSALLRQKLANLELLTEAIREAPLCREGWFRLEKLLGGKNRVGEYIVTNILDGAYRKSERQADIRQALDPRVLQP